MEKQGTRIVVQRFHDFVPQMKNRVWNVSKITSGTSQFLCVRAHTTKGEVIRVIRGQCSHSKQRTSCCAPARTPIAGARSKASHYAERRRTVSMGTKQIGHSSLRMIEERYARFSSDAGVLAGSRVIELLHHLNGDSSDNENE